MLYMKTPGQFIRAHRKRIRKTLTEFWSPYGASTGLASQYERGQTGIRTSLLIQIAKDYNLDLNEMCGIPGQSGFVASQGEAFHVPVMGRVEDGKSVEIYNSAYGSIVVGSDKYPPPFTDEPPPATRFPVMVLYWMVPPHQYMPPPSLVAELFSIVLF